MIRQAVVVVPLPTPGTPVVLAPPEGFPVWAGCLPSRCSYEWREGEFCEVPAVIVMWESRLDFTSEDLDREWSTNPSLDTAPAPAG